MMSSFNNEQRRDKDRGTCRAFTGVTDAGRCRTCQKALTVFNDDNRVGCLSCRSVLSCSACKGWKATHVAAVRELCAEISKTRALLKSVEGNEMHVIADKLQMLTNFAKNAHEVIEGKPIVLHERRSHNITGYLYWRKENKAFPVSSQREISCICGYVKSIAGAHYGDQQAGHVARALAQSRDKLSAVQYPAFCGSAGPSEDALLRSIIADCSVLVAGEHTIYHNRPVPISVKAWNLMNKQDRDVGTEFEIESLNMLLPPRVLLTASISALFENQLILHRWCAEQFAGYRNPFFSRTQLSQVFLLNAFIMDRKRFDTLCGETLHLFDMLQHQMGSFQIDFKRHVKGSGPKHSLAADLLKKMRGVVNGDLDGEKGLILHNLLPIHHCSLNIQTTKFAMPFAVKECFEKTFQVREGLPLSGCSYVELLESSAEVELEYDGKRVRFFEARDRHGTSKTLLKTGTLSFAAQHGSFTSVAGACFENCVQHILDDESRMMVFYVSIAGSKGTAFSDNYVVRGTHVDDVYTCKEFTVPSCLCPGLVLPQEFEIKSIGANTHIRYMRGHTQHSMERAVLKKLNKKIISPSEYLCRCSASKPFNEDNGFKEIDEAHRQQVMNAHRNNRLAIFYERGRRSRMYYIQNCLHQKFTPDNINWTAKAGRRYIRERLSELMHDEGDVEMQTISIALSDSLTLHITTSDSNIVCATVSAIKLLESSEDLRDEDNEPAFKRLSPFHGFPTSVRVGSKVFDVDGMEPSMIAPLAGDCAVNKAEIRTDFYPDYLLGQRFQIKRHNANYYVCANGLAYKIMNEREKKLPLCALLGASKQEVVRSMLRMYRVRLSMSFIDDAAMLKQSRLTINRITSLNKFVEASRSSFSNKNVGINVFSNEAILCQLKSTDITFEFNEKRYRKLRAKTLNQALPQHRNFRYYTCGAYTDSKESMSLEFPGTDNGSFTGTIKMDTMPVSGDDGKPHFPFGFYPKYRPTSCELEGAEFKRSLFFPCSREQLRYSDVAALFAYGYNFYEGVEHWCDRCGMYLQSRVVEWVQMLSCWRRLQHSLSTYIDTCEFNVSVPFIAIKFKTNKSVVTAAPMDTDTAAKCLLQMSEKPLSEQAFLKKHSIRLHAGAKDDWYTNIISFLRGEQI